MRTHPKTAIAKVKLADGREVALPITSGSKPLIPQEIRIRWQDMLDLAANVLKVPAGLITNLKPERLEIFISSTGEGNPFHPGDSLALGSGMYCETTTGTRDLLHVPDAPADALWRDNPSLALNLVSYLGMPLRWPDGELFGTMCMLDTKRNDHSETSRRLLAHFRRTIEEDLRHLQERDELRRENADKDLTLREAHHRIKNHLNILMSVIQLRSTRTGEFSPEAFDAFVRDISDRICCISTLHARMAASNGDEADLRTVVTSIVDTLTASIADSDVATELDIEPVKVNRTTCFHTGLLVGELVTNSLKHAFDGVNAPRIRISARDRGDGTLRLEYADNGAGLPEAQEPGAKPTIGMLIIRDLPARMGGDYEMPPGPGFRFACTLDKQAH